MGGDESRRTSPANEKAPEPPPGPSGLKPIISGARSEDDEIVGGHQGFGGELRDLDGGVFRT
jgi:hypothetical protein